MARRVVFHFMIIKVFSKVRGWQFCAHGWKIKDKHLSKYTRDSWFCTVLNWELSWNIFRKFQKYNFLESKMPFLWSGRCLAVGHTAKTVNRYNFFSWGEEPLAQWGNLLVEVLRTMHPFPRCPKLARESRLSNWHNGASAYSTAGGEHTINRMPFSIEFWKCPLGHQNSKAH